jgi:hypothetical protein
VVWKRMLVAAVGIVALAASAIAAIYAHMALGDFKNPAVPFRFALLGNLVMWSTVVTLLLGGFRFLRFGWSGKNTASKPWVMALVMGAGFFFPGFVSSLPLTLFWANHHWAGKAQSELPAFEVSFYIGIATSLVCFVALLKRGKPKIAHP